MESYYSTGWQHPQSGAPPQVEITSPAGAWPRNPVWHNPTSDETPRQTSGGRSSGNAYVWSPPISPACIYRESPRLESYASPTSPSWGGHPQAYDGGVVAPQPFYSPSKAIPIRSPNHRAVTSVVTSPISPVSPASPEAFSPIYGRGPPKPSYNWGAHAEGGQIISCNWGEEQMSSQNRSRREQPTSPQMYYSPMLSPQRVSDHGGRAAYFGWDGGVESEGAVVSPRSGVASPRLVEVIKVAEIKPAKESEKALPADPFGMTGEAEEMTDDGMKTLKARKKSFEASESVTERGLMLVELLLDRATSPSTVCSPVSRLVAQRVPLGGALPALLEAFAERRFSDGELFFEQALAASWQRPDAERRCLADAVLAFLDVRVMNCGHVYTGTLKIAEREFGDQARGAAPGEVAESRAHKTGEFLTRIFMGHKGPGPALVELMFEKMPRVGVRRDLVAGVFHEVLAKSRKKVAKVHYAQSSGVARWWKGLATGGDVSFEEWLDRDLGMTVAEVLPEDGGPKGQQRKQAAAAAGLARSRSLPHEARAMSAPATAQRPNERPMSPPVPPRPHGRPMSPPMPPRQNDRAGAQNGRGLGRGAVGLERTWSAPTDMARIGGETPRTSLSVPPEDSTVSISAVLSEEGHVTWLSPRKDERAARYDQPVSSQRGDTRAVRSQLTAAIATDRKNGTPREKRVSGPKQSGQYSGGEDVGQVASPRQDAVPVGQPGIPAEVRVNEEEWRRVTSELKRIVSLGPGPDRLREIAEVILDSAAQT